MGAAGEAVREKHPPSKDMRDMPGRYHSLALGSGHK